MRPVRLRRKSVLINLALATAVLGGAGYAYSAVGDEGGSSASSATRTGKVTKGTVMATVSASGSLSSPSDVGVEFSAAGKVTSVAVKVGDTVKAGQVLARIDTTSAQAAVETARAGVDVAEANLNKAKAGTPVQTSGGNSGGGADTQNSVLRESTSSGSTGGTTGSASGTTGGGSKGTAGGASAGTAGDTNGSIAGGTSSSGGGLPTATSTPAAPRSSTAPSGRTPPTVTVTITKTATATPSPSTTVDAAEVTQAEAALAQARVKLTQAQAALAGCVLKAPSAGTVASVDGKVGDSVSAGSSTGSSSSGGSSSAGGASGGGSTTSSTATVTGFVVLANPTGMETKVSFSEADAAKVKTGQPATVTLNVDAATRLNAHVVSVNPLPDAGATSGSVKYGATIALDGDVSKLRTGQTANISVVVARAENALQVPSAAVTGTGASASVRVRVDGAEQRRTVAVGVVGDQSTEIVSGLAEGDEIVVGTTATGSTSSNTSGGGRSGAAGGLTGGATGGGGGMAPGGGFPGGGAR